MSSFESDGINQMIAQIEKLSNRDETYYSMISAGQDILKNAIINGASKHIQTGRMVNGVYSTTPVKNSQNDWIGRVKFQGSSGTYKTKTGKKYDITNWLKAYRIEYGTSKQAPSPFLRPAIISSESIINKKMEEIFNHALEELK